MTASNAEQANVVTPDAQPSQAATIEQPQQPPAGDTQPAPNDTPDSQDSELPDWARQKLDKVNREAKNLRDRLKEQEPLVAAAQEAERAKMSELDRERAEKADLVKQLEARNIEVLQARFNLTDDDLEFIGSGTFEEQLARAAKFASRVQAAPQSSDARPPSERPVESLKPGASPSAPPVEDNSYPTSWGFMPSVGT